mgnify:FL=1
MGGSEEIINLNCVKTETEAASKAGFPRVVAGKKALLMLLLTFIIGSNWRNAKSVLFYRK